MAVLENLSEEECYLYAILTDPSGLDQGEFMIMDHERENLVWRAWSFQHKWFRCVDTLQLDCCARSVGKSLSITRRAVAFPFVHTGQEMVITAPELNHLTPVVSLVEKAFKDGPRLLQEMVPKGKNQGITHKPYQQEFLNGCRILGRIPQRDGKGIKGCVGVGTMVLTRRGLVPVETVVEGDFVWSHLNRWSEVRVVESFEDDCFEVKGQGAFPLTVSQGHQFYVRNDISSQPGKTAVKLGIPHWERVESLTSSPYQPINAYWTSMTDLSLSEMVEMPSLKITNKNCKLVQTDSESFWWVVGRFLADGFTSWEKGVHRGRVHFVVHPLDQEDLVQNLKDMGFNPRVKKRDHSSADDLEICSVSLAAWLDSEFGKLANGKRIPVWVYFLRESYRRALLVGYQSGDGDHAENPARDNRIGSGSASKALTLGLGLLASGLGMVVGYSRIKVNVSEIVGVALKSEPQDSWRLRVTSSRGQGYFQPGFVSYKIRSVKPVGQMPVYNVISDDHSYWADGVFQHNTHPLWLEMDEAQDWTPQAWVEIIETLKRGVPGAVWRCIAAGQLVFTSNGWTPIEAVNVGDEVLTHENRWKPVIRVFDNGTQDCVKVNGQGHPGIIATKEHKFYVSNLSKRTKKRTKRELADTSWTPVTSFVPGVTQWASPASFPGGGVIPAMTAPKKHLPTTDTSTSEWLWLYGLYLSEGYGADFLHGGRSHRRSCWCVNNEEAPEVADRLRGLGFNPSFYTDPKRSQKSVKVCIASAACHDWLVSNAGSLATNKRFAPWVLSLSTDQRQAIFDGLTYGDASWSTDRKRWEHFTASHRLALDIKLLGQSLGYVSNVSKKTPRQSVIEGRTVHSKGGWTIQMTQAEPHRPLQTRLADNMAWSHVSESEPVGSRRVYDLEVADDHSYVVEGMVVSNCHGVTRGVRDDFYKFSQPGSDWTVHRMTALHRPNWTDKERQEKIEQYGSKNSPDYRRNILGQHGDASNPLFVLARLMACVDKQEFSEYNLEEYKSLRINSEALEEVGGRVDLFLDFPGTHKSYERTWAGMDVGWTASPSELLVFGEIVTKDKPSVLKLLLRIHMERLDAVAQADVVLRVLDYYRCRVFALDATGAGLPLYQILQHRTSDILDRIKGFNFSEKRIVDIDLSVEVDEFRGDPIKDAAIERNVLDHSSDKIRELVDQKRILLPWDRDLIGEWQGQTWSVGKGVVTDSSGRPSLVFSKGKVHTLDAGKMAVMGFVTAPLEELFAQMRKREPVHDFFMGGGPVGPDLIDVSVGSGIQTIVW